MLDICNANIKAVFFDVDGTLISLKTRTIPESAQKAIERLRKKGIKVIVATGRSINDLGHIKHIEFDGFLTYNGALCITTDGHVMHRQSIDSNDIKNLVHYSERSALTFTLMYEDKVKISAVSPQVVELYTHLNLPVPPLYDKDDLDIENVLQVSIFIDPENEESFMQKVMPNSLSSRWTPLFAHVNPGGVSKQKGIQYFCEHFNIDVSETMAFGDGGNDISMLKFVNIGVAMGNAGENVKKIADFVTEEVDNNGVEAALLHYGLLS
ncbi:Cof-type HAD-IIB family hydrolase [Chryseobacterium sp. B21-037]|uniref:Cof-type HAD-IIB family hydrolase n=1 Tax=Chryseobacterium sp. B21-037 TaxID=2926038 RepID=UPI00235880F1|nr:Cof-type HAD-IIB family hydrolase [Chryseobacterium sp. B21-037]MDC8104981.1 Cof-type HAD-IIB family hydrolase [Chryseobacterium sp. B21-037]